MSVEASKLYKVEGQGLTQVQFQTPAALTLSGTAPVAYRVIDHGEQIFILHTLVLLALAVGLLALVASVYFFFCLLYGNNGS